MDGSASRAEELLAMPLEQTSALDLGSLENGLRYVILPNRSPPARFEAHLEIHAGSGDCPDAAACTRRPLLRLARVMWPSVHRRRTAAAVPSKSQGGSSCIFLPGMQRRVLRRPPLCRCLRS